MKRGRRAASESRAVEIRARLLAWKQAPEPGRMSLRALAAGMGTSHQLLSFYLKRLGKWQGEEYRRKANDLRARAKAENRYMTPGEEAQMIAYERAGFHSMIDSVLADTLPRMLRELQADAKAGRLSKGQIKMVNLFARSGYPIAQKILQKHSQHMNDAPHQSRGKIGKNNLPVIPSDAAKSFRRV